MRLIVGFPVLLFYFLSAAGFTNVQEITPSSDAYPILGDIQPSATGRAANVFESEHFRIEYDAIGGGLTIDDYVTALEHTWETMIDEFGWAAPPVYTPNPVPGGRYLVRIQGIGDPNLAGYATIVSEYAGLIYDNPNTAWHDFDAYASILVLDSDFSRPYATAQQMLEGTVAHEFNHAIQYGYGVLSGSNHAEKIFVEGGANWAVDEVFDGENRTSREVWPYFDSCMGDHEGNPYFYWLTFRGLTERYGVGVPGGGEQIMQDFWENTSRSTSSNMFPALDGALANKGSSLPDAFHDYAIALRFTKSCPAAEPYCFADAKAYTDAAGKVSNTDRILSTSGMYNGSLEDNYAINYIGMPFKERYAIEFENLSEGGEFRVSIVADLGDELLIEEFPSLIGGNQTLEMPVYIAPEGTARIVAVITNQDQTSDNPTSCTANPYAIRLQPVDILEADLSIEQADSVDPVGKGEELVYTVSVANAGPDGASEVTIADILPIGSIFLSASENCSEENGVVNCDLGNLPANSQTSVQVTIRTPDDKGADLSNYVEVTAAEHDPNTADNESVEITKMGQMIILPLVMSN